MANPTEMLMEFLGSPRIDNAQKVLLLVRNNDGSLKIMASDGMTFRTGISIMSEATGVLIKTVK